jgi:ribosome-associated toxin RatA of RatAB toxin-antitoxin module
LVAGPLRALDGVWTFSPVGSNGCRIQAAAAVRSLSNAIKAALLVR